MGRLARRVVLVLACAVVLGRAPGLSPTVLTVQPAVQDRVLLPPTADLQALDAYIKRTWTTLTRSVKDLPAAAHDPKLHLAAGERWPVYLSRTENRAAVERALAAALTEKDRATIELRVLPPEVASIAQHGLLYLPHPYVVPGGRFNEMYGWDSYFIQVGLLRDDEIGLARDMADNFVYEIEHYGTVLNANRTYYLTRSQPPFLTRMVLGVFERTHDRAWLRKALPAIDRYYAFWTTGDHLNAATGLSRYFDVGHGPAPEAIADERDAQGRTHYDRVREYYKTHRVTDYDVNEYYDAAADRLTPLFYKGDRSMRESGFDPSNRYGPFSVDIVHYVPVCLNALLFQMERDGETIAQALGMAEAAREWRTRADRRRAAIDRYLWDPAAGLYRDYNFVSGKRRDYLFATILYPLWAGAASPEQAAKVRAQLRELEAPGGLLTSTTVSGSQWDAPFGWAPLQMIAVEGLRRYGFVDDADRIATKFIALVSRDFKTNGTIVEKYDVQRGSSDVAAAITFGYSANQIGFGWTNAAMVEMLARMGQGAPAEPVPAAR
jgi:alpha,alpha-trehalase